MMSWTPLYRENTPAEARDDLIVALGVSLSALVSVVLLVLALTWVR